MLALQVTSLSSVCCVTVLVNLNLTSVNCVADSLHIVDAEVTVLVYSQQVYSTCNPNSFRVVGLSLLEQHNVLSNYLLTVSEELLFDSLELFAQHLLQLCRQVWVGSRLTERTVKEITDVLVNAVTNVR